MKTNPLLALLIPIACFSFAAASHAQTNPSLLERRYQEGEKLVYQMKGDNDGWRYQARATGVVKKAANGAFTEEYAWSDFINDGKPFTLSPASTDFRQPLTLDPLVAPSVPDLSRVQPLLIGPITDMLTIYSDLWLAAKMPNMTRVGSHSHFFRGTPNSWADGKYVTLGEDSIDFDFSIADIDPAAKTAKLLVRHVVPSKPQISLPAEWMQKPVADTPNNWVQVKHDGTKYVASVGKETFDVQLTLSLLDGKLLSAIIENPVDTLERDCQDEALTKCSEPRSHRILRHIELSLVP